jgi:beta-glucosidase
MVGSFDLIGFSYYCAYGVSGPGGPVPYPTDGRVGPLGYVPWADGLGLTLRRLAEELPGRPLLVAEYGVGTDDDDWRGELLRDGVAEVESAIADGIDVRGLFHWTSVDNYEWLYGYDVPFGLFDRDRAPRPSADLLSTLSRRQPRER